MQSFVQKIVDFILNKPYYLRRIDYPADIEPAFIPLHTQCRPYTMTSLERMHTLYKAVEYVVNGKIPGDCVECGVWRGGSSMLAALALQTFGDTHRDLYLYDTYEGMSKPSEKDRDFQDAPAAPRWEQDQQAEYNRWCLAPLEEVTKSMRQTDYPEDKVKFVKGKVEDTLPKIAPDKIAILRLDTDWYESTYHELTHLFPRLVVGGILIIDDYGHWKGAREAVDQYFAEQKLNVFLHRIDDTGRLAVKLRV
jgi:hypothetical protein